MPSILGGGGISVLNALGPSGIAAASQAIGNFLRNQQAGLARQHNSNERRKDREFQKKRQEKAEKNAFKNQLTTLGISAGAGALGGAVLGGLGASGVAAAGPEVAASTAATSGIGDVDGGSLGAGALPFEALMAPSAAAASGDAASGAALGAGGGALLSQANQPSLPNYAFGNSRGGSVATGAALGALNTFSPGLLQAGAALPMQRAEFGLRQQALGRQAANDVFNQSVDVAKLGLAQQREGRLQSQADFNNEVEIQKQNLNRQKFDLDVAEFENTAGFRQAQLGQEDRSLGIRERNADLSERQFANTQDYQNRRLGQIDQGLALRQQGLADTQAQRDISNRRSDLRLSNELTANVFNPPDITSQAESQLRGGLGLNGNAGASAITGADADTRAAAKSVADFLRVGNTSEARRVFEQNKGRFDEETRKLLEGLLGAGQ